MEKIKHYLRHDNKVNESVMILWGIKIYVKQKKFIIEEQQCVLFNSLIHFKQNIIR